MATRPLDRLTSSRAEHGSTGVLAGGQAVRFS